MLYFLLKLIIRVALRVFFRKITVIGSEHIPAQGPLIVVANHPNTFMDPMLIAAHLKTKASFLANASIFDTAFNRWLFKQLNMIPIQRKHDTNKQRFDNTQIFAQAHQFLAKGGTLLIFPEGTSIRERRLQPLKTGTARIALGASALASQVQILVIGLNYSKPESFRSEVLIHMAPPIAVDDYKEAYAQDEVQAVQTLTEAIREQLEEQIIITAGKEEDELLRQIETVYLQSLSAEMEINPKNREQAFQLTQKMAEALQWFSTQQPTRVYAFRRTINAYFRNLQRLGLDEINLVQTGKQHPWLQWLLRRGLALLLGLPVFLYGLLNSYVPYIIPSQVAAWLVRQTKVEEYTAPVMMVTGIFSFALFYGLQIWLCYFLTGGSLAFTAAYAFSLPITGFFALFYAHLWDVFVERWQRLNLFWEKAGLMAFLITERQKILQSLEQFRKEYMALLTSAQTDV